jgi:rhodanese-related sulfurtransferase
MVILDVRRFEEYNAMNIPGGINVPGAELILRIRDLVASPETLLLVNCAGRTRSIIGAQSLINAGIPNPVAALQNGTIGWTLAGYSLAHGQTRSFGETTRAAKSWAQEASRRVAAKAGVLHIDIATLDRWVANAGERTLYRFDVRTPEEYEIGHPAGFRSAPGGQLVQAVDEWVAVRGARLVLFSDDQVRATMTASWLVQMGWEAVVIEPGALGLDQKGPQMPRRPEKPENGVDIVTPGALACFPGVSTTIVDLAPSPQYLRGHIPGAHFAIRSRFALDLPELGGTGAIVLTSPDGFLAAFASAEAALATRRPIKVLDGGTKAWVEAGQPLEQAPHWVSPQIDVYKRPYEGTDNAVKAMEDYITWELQLVAQLANDGVCRFRVTR